MLLSEPERDSDAPDSAKSTPSVFRFMSQIGFHTPYLGSGKCQIHRYIVFAETITRFFEMSEITCRVFKDIVSCSWVALKRSQ
mmetsp:Transcript_106732/g.184110  ORF Transcript_106732/g.184110 Transcript_106732/m.184110 type:complete len:83 (+) Transcript_106732:1126-1374(+)